MAWSPHLDEVQADLTKNTRLSCSGLKRAVTAWAKPGGKPGESRLGSEDTVSCASGSSCPPLSCPNVSAGTGDVGDEWGRAGLPALVAPWWPCGQPEGQRGPWGATLAQQNFEVVLAVWLGGSGSGWHSCQENLWEKKTWQQCLWLPCCPST